MWGSGGGGFPPPGVGVSSSEQLTTDTNQTTIDMNTCHTVHCTRQHNAARVSSQPSRVASSFSVVSCHARRNAYHLVDRWTTCHLPPATRRVAGSLLSCQRTNSHASDDALNANVR